jgi:cytochrome c biogenesis protein CcmG/thiol:disulfide interchange protein DsbE
MKTLSIRFLIPFAIFLLLILFLWRGLQLDPRLLPSPLLNKPAPDFQLPDLENPKLYLSKKNLLGHVSLVNVWASWCETCQQEQAFLMTLALAHQIPIYAIDYKDNAVTAKQWLKHYGDPYRRIGFDADGKVGIDWGVYGTPETFVIDKTGVIRYKVVGALTPQIWRKEVLPLIAKLITHP